MFIPDARQVFSLNMCGTAPSCLKPSATRWGMIFQCSAIVVMSAVCYECVVSVLWMCYECIMNVYGYVMDMLWMCYGCIMDVLGIVRNVLRMYAWWIFYIYCVNCIVNGIVIVILWLYCDETVILIIVFCFSGIFIWPNIKQLGTMSPGCVFVKGSIAFLWN